jgi:hypothetical protein
MAIRCSHRSGQCLSAGTFMNWISKLFGVWLQTNFKSSIAGTDGERDLNVQWLDGGTTFGEQGGLCPLVIIVAVHARWLQPELPPMFIPSNRSVRPASPPPAAW